MKLYELMKTTKEDYDTYDTVYDNGVTACYIEESKRNDNYDKFCINLMKKVEVESKNGDCLVVGWTELISNNMEKFKEFSREYWRDSYEDDEDEFIYQWINEIHNYMVGNVSDSFYAILVKFVKTLEV